MLILARIIFLTQKIAIVTNPITCIMAEKEVEFNDIMNWEYVQSDYDDIILNTYVGLSIISLTFLTAERIGPSIGNPYKC